MRQRYLSPVKCGAGAGVAVVGAASVVAGASACGVGCETGVSVGCASAICLSFFAVDDCGWQHARGGFEEQ